MNQPEVATIWATMENSSHPEYGVAMIPFPIPREDYDSYMEKLQAMAMLSLTFHSGQTSKSC